MNKPNCWDFKKGFVSPVLADDGNFLICLSPDCLIVAARAKRELMSNITKSKEGWRYDVPVI